MSKKVFEIGGIAKATVFWRGLSFKPNQQLKIYVNEDEVDFYSQFIEVLSLKEQVVVEEQEKEVVIKIPKNVEEPIVVETAIENTKEKVQKPKPTQTPKQKPSTTAKPKSNNNNQTTSRAKQENS